MYGVHHADTETHHHDTSFQEHDPATTNDKQRSSPFELNASQQQTNTFDDASATTRKENKEQQVTHDDGPLTPERIVEQQTDDKQQGR